MTLEQRSMLRVVGVTMMVLAVMTIPIAPPAIQMTDYGFFWWGFMPGAVFAAGLCATIVKEHL